MKQVEGYGFYILLILTFLVFFSFVSSFLEDRKWPIHRGAVSITVGIILGLILYLSGSTNYDFIVKFDQQIIFTVLFPIMFYVEGYTINKNILLKNIRNITLYGCIGTLLSFSVTTSLLYYANQFNLIRGTQDTSRFRSLQWWQILILSACLCSTDTDASTQAISEHKFPKLHTLVVGQSVFKDVMTIVLMNSILKLQNQENSKQFQLSIHNIFVIIGYFIYVIFISVLFGLIIGCIVSFCFKHFRFLQNDKGITETVLLFLLGMITYLAADEIKASGVVSILTFGIILKEVNIHNISRDAMVKSEATLNVMYIICEGLLFLIMGVIVWQVRWLDESSSSQITHSFIFVLAVMVILFLGRVVNIYVLGFIAMKISKKYTLKKQQMKILFFSGLVRGATAFALFSSVKLNDNKDYAKNQGLVLKTTIIIIVMFCNIILNSLLPTIYKSSLKSLEESLNEQLLNPIQKQDMPQRKKRRIRILLEKLKDKILPFLIYQGNSTSQEPEQEKQQHSNFSPINQQ